MIKNSELVKQKAALRKEMTALENMLSRAKRESINHITHPEKGATSEYQPITSLVGVITDTGDDNPEYMQSILNNLPDYLVFLIGHPGKIDSEDLRELGYLAGFLRGKEYIDMSDLVLKAMQEIVVPTRTFTNVKPEYRR